MNYKFLISLSFALLIFPFSAYHADGQELVTKDQFIEILRYTGHEGDYPKKKIGLLQDQKKTEVAVTIYVLFKTGTTELADDFSIRQMEEAGEALSSDNLRGYHFEIAGHSDSMGSDVDNIKLSLDRAKAVKRLLVQFYGIPEEQLITTGYGESMPITSNETEEGRAKNRRVVFIRLDNRSAE